MSLHIIAKHLGGEKPVILYVKGYQATVRIP